MNSSLRLAVAGVGNNIAALFQGVYFYHDLFKLNKSNDLPGIKRFAIGPYRVFDIDFVAAFDVNIQKIGKPLNEAIFTSPNNYPALTVDLPQSPTTVSAGPLLDGLSAPLMQSCHPHSLNVTQKEVIDELKRSKAEVLLYSLPTGAPMAAEFYASCALEAGVAFVNCTPEKIARNLPLLEQFQKKGIPLIGDDLASHMGSSIVHRTLMKLFSDRGITLDSSYQLNLGGNSDFKNLMERGASKMTTKKSALNAPLLDLSKVEVIPSAGFIKSLQDHKVGIMHLEGIGWGGTPVQLDVTLKVQDSSNAAGVIIDLIRIAAVAKKKGMGGFIEGAEYLLKSSPTEGCERTSEFLDCMLEQFACL